MLTKWLGGGRAFQAKRIAAIQRAAYGVETLENRCLLSATLLAQIPTTTVTAGSTPTTIALGTYLNDPQLTGGTVVEMQTPLGNMFLQLTNSATPSTVANFVDYINNGEYQPTIIQRSAPGFVLQGGGTKPDGSNNTPVQTLNGEPGISNTAGTIAMALSSGPNSGTNQWFINLADNSSILDGAMDGGPFTVFGNVIDGGMTIANAIAQLQIINGSAENPNWYIGTNDGLPVLSTYTGSAAPTTVPANDLVTDNIVVVPAAQAAPTYTAVSANPGLVTARVANGVLTLTPASNLTVGTTTVSATVTDLAGQSITSTFTVNLTDSSQLAFASLPSVATAGAAISTPITVNINDVNGGLSAGDNSNVTLAIATGPAGATLTGTTTIAAVNGVATFSGLSFSTAGAYTLTATDGNLTSATSAALDVAAPLPAAVDATFGAATGGVVALSCTVNQSQVLPTGQILLACTLPGSTTQGALAELNSDGTSNTSFGGGVVKAPQDVLSFLATAVQSDGRIVTAGESNGAFFIGRYNADGSVDTTFGNGGFATADFGGNANAVPAAVAIEPDGSIIVVGSAFGECALARFTSSGQLDASFNPGGADTSLFPGGGEELLGGTVGSLTDVFIDGSGKIVVAGDNSLYVTVVRLNPDGSPDASFATNGVLPIMPGLSSEDPNGITVGPSIAAGVGGAIIVSGEATGGGIAIDRLTPAGALDTTFGTNGTETVGFGGGASDRPCVVSVDPANGDVAMIGTTVLNGVAQTAVAALDADGTLDSGYGTAGVVTLPSVASGATSGIHLSAVDTRAVAFGGFDSQQRIIVGSASRTSSSSILQRLQPFVATSKTIGTAAVKPLVFEFTNSTFHISATGGSAAVVQVGSQFDITLTPRRSGGAMTVLVHEVGASAFTLDNIDASAVGRLSSFIAPAATLAGTLSTGSAIGTLRLGNVSGTVIAGSIASLTAANVSGSITTAASLGVVHLQNVTGVIAAGTIIRSFFATNVGGATILAGDFLGSSGQLGSGNTFGPGSILSMSLGAISDSFVGAGVNPVDGIFGNGNDTAESGVDKIVVFRVTSGLGAGAIIETFTFPRFVHLPRLVKPTTDPSAFVQLT